MSLRVGDDREAVLQNRATALRLLEVPKHRLVTVKQVHGNAVVQVTQNAGRQIRADGLWTEIEKLPLPFSLPTVFPFYWPIDLAPPSVPCMRVGEERS